jgi:MOSC domain-containing protein YiiM
MAQLLDIAYRTAKRAPMLLLDTAKITAETGVNSDSRGKPGKRQVTILSKEAWERACNDLGNDLPWTTRRANLLIEGLDLENTTSQQIIIGDVVLEINGETDPCSRMDEASEGLKNAMMSEWRGGVLCSVISGGTVSKGDEVILK